MQAAEKGSDHPIQTPHYTVQILGYGVIVALTGLSLWAVGAVQLASRPDGDLTRYWYLTGFLALEVWVCAGLFFSTMRFRQGRWGAGTLALMIWLAAVSLSAVQERRFHILFDGKLEAETAESMTAHVNAEKRAGELEAELTAMTKPSRSVAAIQAELDGYEKRRDAQMFPTRITALRSELKSAEAFADTTKALADQRAILEATASVSAERLDARKAGQSLRLFGKEIGPDGYIWILIATMLAIKSLGPWLLMGPSVRTPKPGPKAKPDFEAVDTPDWVEVDRKDRNGKTRRVRVPRAA